MKEFIEKIDKKQCYGCRACEQICPNECISMIENEEGFLFPRIDNKACNECGLCEKACPAVEENILKIFHEPAVNVYAAWNNNLQERMNSSSGGVFPILAKTVLNNGGTVYGCAWKENSLEAHQIRITSVNDIPKLQGSKYVQSSTDDTFIKVKQDLQTRREVLYTGTPCQIAGLRLFLGKEYDNLTTVDLICHGTPSPKLLSEYVKYIEEKYGKITDLKFRDKKKSGYSAYLSFITAEKQKITELIGLSPFMVGFYKAFYNRESCYQCKFTAKKRVSDITIADFWGFSLFHPGWKEEEKYGVSCILSNTSKGDFTITLIDNDLTLVNSTLSNCSAKQPSLSNPNPRPNYRDIVFKDLNGKGFKFLANGILRPRLYWLHKFTPAWVRNLLRPLKRTEL